MNRLFLPQISNKFSNAINLSKKLSSLGSWNIQIKQIREALGMTQKQVANKIKSTQQQYSSIEKGNTNPTLNTLNRIAESLNCKLQINFIPNEELEKTVYKQAEKKVTKLLKMSLANAAMEDQKPSKKIVKNEKEYLINKLINENRNSLWED